VNWEGRIFRQCSIFGKASSNRIQVLSALCVKAARTKPQNHARKWNSLSNSSARVVTLDQQISKSHWTYVDTQYLSVVHTAPPWQPEFGRKGCCLTEVLSRSLRGGTEEDHGRPVRIVSRNSQCPLPLLLFCCCSRSWDILVYYSTTGVRISSGADTVFFARPAVVPTQFSVQ
jgi:hypothetical protein